MTKSNTPTADIPIGPQNKGDDPLARRMRFHQSWYRARVLGLRWGTGPEAYSKGEYGNMLTQEDGQRGMNFLTPELFDLATGRLADDSGLVSEYRLLHNMLSSQPMCFNLFGYLELNPNLASATFAALDPDVARVTDIRMEWAPEPASAYLNDRTAFDAFVEYQRKDGTRGLFGIETKLTEKFSEREYDTPAYRQWLDVPNNPWRPETADHLPRKAHNQLWRNHMLAFSLQHLSPEYTTGTVAVVGHPEDTKLTQTIQNYQALLTNPDSIKVWSIDHIANAIESVLEHPQQHEWLEAFRDRYLRLELSEGNWLSYHQQMRQR